MVKTQFKIHLKEKLEREIANKILEEIIQIFERNGIEFEGISIHDITHILTYGKIN